jgi:hypothetical protein
MKRKLLICAAFIAVTAQAADKKRYLKLLAILTIGLLSWLPGNVQPLRADEPNPVTAIDICLEPDATMVQHAEAVNARLRGVFPEGFALDASHRPHITLVQRFLRTADLDQVYAAAGKVIASHDVAGLKLEAFKYYYIPNKELGLSGIVIKPTPELLKLEQDVVDAVAPFTVKTGTSAAFVKSEDPGVNQLLINYVEVFVPEHSGEHFNPHVTTGLATREYLDKMLAEPFENFTFSPAGAAVYHLGPYGTAAEKLKQLDLKP